MTTLVGKTFTMKSDNFRGSSKAALISNGIVLHILKRLKKCFLYINQSAERTDRSMRPRDGLLNCSLFKRLYQVFIKRGLFCVVIREFLLLFFVLYYFSWHDVCMNRIMLRISLLILFLMDYTIRLKWCVIDKLQMAPVVLGPKHEIKISNSDKDKLVLL